MVDEYISEEEKSYIFQGKILPPLYLEFLKYLREVKGVARGTVHNLKKPILRFLMKSPPFGTKQGIKKLREPIIQKYVTETAPALSWEGKKKLVNSMREYFRFLHLKGYISKDFSTVVPSLVSYRMTTIQRGLPWEKVEELLKVPDRKTHTGRRDYAILLMFALYGVRQGQLIDLKMSEINWKLQTIHFRAVKGGRDVVVPLFPEMAEALIEYFKGGRKDAPAKYQEVFLTTGRGGSVVTGQRRIGRALWYMIHRRLKAIGITEASEVPRGPHSIRHALATRMIEKNQPIKTISDLLGHRSIETTFIYTKSDIKRLRKLKVEWPDSCFTRGSK
jgi:integrase/recombinase XerD